MDVATYVVAGVGVVVWWVTADMPECTPAQIAERRARRRAKRLAKQRKRSGLTAVGYVVWLS